MTVLISSSASVKSIKPAPRCTGHSFGHPTEWTWPSDETHLRDRLPHRRRTHPLLVTAGFPDLGTGSMAERRQRLAEQHDQWRAACVLEPRGSDVLVGALLCEPVDPSACAGVIFFNNSGYLGMCGHGTIGLVASLAHLGKIGPGVHSIETPVGTVQATLHDDHSVSVRNVPAYRYRKALQVQVPGIGQVTGDIAWGGNLVFP